MTEIPEPTERELQILKVLWDRREATVREVYEALRDEVPIVQNTVQAFLRTMEDKGLVSHRSEGRTFVYRAAFSGDRTKKHLLHGLLDSVFDGALDQLVASALQAKKPSSKELARLRTLLAEDSAQAGQVVMPALENVFGAIVEHGPGLFVGVTIVLASGLLWARAQRTAAARRRMGIWTALAAGLYLAVAALPLPRVVLSEPVGPPVSIATGPDTPATALPAGATRAEVIAALAVDQPGALPAEASSLPPVADPAPVPAQGAPSATSIDWPYAFALVYLCSAALLLVHHLLGLFRLGCIVRRSRTAPLATRTLADLPNATRLLFSHRPVRPFCAGWLRPIVVLSPELEHRHDLLAAVLRHEAAHLRARDPLVQSLFALLALPLVLHPLFWWLRADVRFQSELLADERAAGDQRTDYARELLDLVDDPTPMVAAVGTIAVFHRPSAFYRRIQMLLQPKTPSSRPLSRARRAGQFTAMLALVATTAGVFGVPATAQDPGQRRALEEQCNVLRSEIDVLRDQIATLRSQLSDTKMLPPGAAVPLPDPVRADPARLPTAIGSPPAAPPAVSSKVPPTVPTTLPAGLPIRGDDFGRVKLPNAEYPIELLPASPPERIGSGSASVEGIVALASRMLDLETEIEIARSKLEHTQALAKSKMVSSGELSREKARLRNLERKRAIVRSLVDGEIKATKTELEWLSRQHKKSSKHDRLRVEMQIQRAESRLDALRAAR